MSKEKLHTSSQHTDTTRPLLSDEAIEAYAFETYHEVEDSRWFEPLQVGAKWSRDILIAEIERRQKMIMSEPDETVRESMVNNLLFGMI